jgi:hypothetical protein
VNRRRRAAGAAVAVAAVAAVGGIAYASSRPDRHPPPRPAPSVTRPAAPIRDRTPPPWVAGLIVSNGNWRVPQDLPPGTYRTEVLGSLNACTWSRVDTAGRTLAEGQVVHGGKATVEVLPTDGGFHLGGGCTWKKDRQR